MKKLEYNLPERMTRDKVYGVDNKSYTKSEKQHYCNGFNECLKQMKDNKEKCFRCGKEGNQTWNICADGNKDKLICEECDIKLNELVLKFMGFKDWRKKIEEYKKSFS